MYKIDYLEPHECWQNDIAGTSCQVIYVAESGEETIICYADDSSASMIVAALQNLAEQTD